MEHIGDEKFLLDTEKNIIWDRKNTTLPNIPALSSLYEGICDLAEKTRAIEFKKFKENNWSFSSLSLMELDTGMLYNYFIWFSVSLPNYLKLIAIIDLSNKNNWTIDRLSEEKIKKKIKNHCREYVAEIIPDIVSWRNKVGAHFLLTDPYSRDNILSMINSVTIVDYSAPYYTTNIATYNNQHTKDQVNKLPSWSLSKRFDDLSKRFFSKNKITTFSDFFDNEHTPQHEDDIHKCKKFCQKAFKNKILDKNKSKMYQEKGILLL